MKHILCYAAVTLLTAALMLSGCGGSQEDEATLNAAPSSDSATIPVPNPNKPILGRSDAGNPGTTGATGNTSAGAPGSVMSDAPKAKTSISRKRSQEGVEMQ